MKSRLTITSLIITAFLFSCGNNSKENKNENSTGQTETAMYQCPMKCEGDKMYDKPGTCPVCKMDLELVSKDVEHKHHNH